MLIWLVPVAVFFTVASTYLGGMSVDVHGGGGVRQILGLLGTFVLYLLIFGVLRLVLGGLGGAIGGLALPLLGAVGTLPLTARVGFGVMGVKLRKVEAH